MPQDDDGVLTLPGVPCAAIAPRPSEEKVTAILCAHGMGQQVPYQTLQMVVDGLEKAPGRTWAVNGRGLATVRVGGEDLRRVELSLARPGPEGPEQRKVHVYEAYWAPITEGKVTLRDVVAFLRTGGVAGLGKSGGTQRRWLFGDWRTFPPIRGATLALFMALVVIAALAVMNLVAFAIVGLQALPDRLVSAVPDPVKVGLAEDATRSLLAFLLLAGVLGTWVGVSAGAVAWARGRPPESATEADLAARWAWLGRLTDAGMSAFAWALGGAMAFLVATAASALAHAWCLQPRAACVADDVRPVALLAVAGVLLLSLFVPRRWPYLGAGFGLALLAASLGAVWPPAAVWWMPPALAALGVVGALGASAWAWCTEERPAPGSRGVERWPYWVLFANVAVAFAFLTYALGLAPTFPILGGETRGLLLAVALAVTGAALVSVLAGAALDRAPAKGSRLALALLAGLLATAVLVLLLLGLAEQPLVAKVLVAWGLVALVALVVRHVLVQYVGDVAAYVTPHKLDRFAGVRADVKARVKAVADAVYGMRTPDGTRLAYDRVVLVAHSLGSVVTYDTLNALLLDDEHASVREPRPGDKPSDHPRLVAERTPLLVTFGSPLDRTGFIFATQRSRKDGEEPTDAGAAMAGFTQPLIAWPPAREGLAWVNLHSRGDIISSALTYYDVPKDQRAPNEPEVPSVINRQDPLAATPLMGHVEYWKGLDVWDTVVDEVFAPPRGRMPEE